MKNLVVKSIIVVFALILFNSTCFAEINTKYIKHLFDQNELIEIEKTLNNIEQADLSKEEKAELFLFYAKLSVEKKQYLYACDYAKKALKFIPEHNNKLKAQANLYKALSYFIKKDFKKTFSTFDTLEQECIKQELKEELADLYFFKGYILSTLDKNDEGMVLYNKALPLYEESNNLKKVIDVELLIAEILNEYGKYDESLHLAQKVLKKNIQLKNLKIEATVYKLLAALSLAQDKTDQSLKYIDKAISISKKIKDNNLLVDSYFWKGMVLIGQEKFDLAEDLYLKSIEIQSKTYGPDHPIIAPAYVSLSSVYSKQAKYDKALEYSLKAHNIFKKAYGENHILTASTYNQMAALYNKLGQYEKALDLYYKSMAIIQLNHGKDSIHILYVYKNIGSVFFKQHKYHEALDWYIKALNLSKKYFKEDNINNSKLYNNLALCFDNLGDYDKAEEYLNKSLNIIINKGDKLNIMTVLGYSNIGGIYEKQRKYNKAIDAYLKAKNIVENNDLSDHSAAAVVYWQLGWTYKMISDYNNALFYYDKALKINQKIYGQKSLESALNYFAVAGIFCDIKNDKEALKNYKIALQLMKKIGNDYYLSFVYTDLGYLKQNQKEYIQAIDYYKKAIEYSNSIINYTAVKNDKYNFVNTNILTGENIIKCFIALNKPEQALFYSDKSRYQDLVSSLSYKKALLSDFIDKNDAKKLEDVENQYTKMHSLCLQTSIGHHQMQDEASIVAIADNTYCKEETFARKQLAEYTRQLDNKYPQFYKKRFNNLNSSVQLQKMLDNKHLQDTAIIEYYLGTNKLYIFIMFNATTQVITSNYSDEDIATLIKNYNKPFRFVSLVPTKSLMIDILKRYDLKTSYELYKILLKEPIEKLQTLDGFNNKTNILIIPHKSLYYLSFESLITENIQKIGKDSNIALSQYAELPYFIKQYSLSYLPNLSFIEYITPSAFNKKEVKNKTLIIGNPDLTITKKYTESVKDLKPLPYSEQESTIIHDILGPKSDLIVADKATEKNIDSKIGQYNNYHFACHGLLNDKEPLYSGLVLSREPYVVSSEKQKGYDGILYAYEILNKQFTSDLVVLSACDSGLGKLQSGEGMLGLTKSFLIAGANSLVITLWKINDASSSLFMKQFYSQLNLHSDINTLDALRQAKLLMINSTNSDFKSGKYDGISYAHPYFWAPFIYYGY